VRIAYLGPEGTWSHQALLDSAVAGEAIAAASLYDTVMTVQEGSADAALVPIENSLEGSVDVTLDTLAIDAPDVEIVGERVAEIRNCLIASGPTSLADIETVYSHPQASAQCARFLRGRVGRAQVVAVSSTAEAVRRVVAEPGSPHAALGNPLAASLYGGHILIEDVDDHPGNQTRFVWLAPAGDADAVRARVKGDGAAKTSIVFYGAGDGSAGWLVNCLAELSTRKISLTRIESRPRRIGLGHYMFFADFGGSIADVAVGRALAGLRAHCEEVRVLGSFHAA
jgi:prephenate dehydratase